MTLRKVMSTGLACAGLYAAVVGGAALAQEASPTGTPGSSPTPVVTVFSDTPAPTATAETTPTTAPTTTPDSTSTPAETAAPTATAPTPFPSPVETMIAPSPTATSTPGQPEGTVEARKRALERGNSKAGKGKLDNESCDVKTKRKSGNRQSDKASVSTSASQCDPDEGEKKKKKKPSVEVDTPRAIERADGTPTPSNPNFSLATPGAAPIGVPNFFIDKFRIPPFLLPLYQAAGIQYGVRWEVLAAINEIETDYGRNLNVSSAGAQGWMQFMPATWKAYGVDANQDKLKDPYNPADAIFAAARYLKAAGADKDLRKAIFAYNHADWYVDSVLMRARLIGGLPANFVGSLTGLTQGRFPVHAKATYAGDLSERDAKRLSKRSRKGGNRALVVESSKQRRGIKIFARRGAPVVAVNDGRIVRVGRTKRLGRFVQLQDVYGNTYTYGRLAKVAKSYPAAKERKTTRAQIAKELELPAKDAKPTGPASATKVRATKRAGAGRAKRAKARPKVTRIVKPVKQRLFAHPTRPNAGRSGGAQQSFQRTGKIDGSTSFSSYFTKVFGLDREDVEIKKLRPGSRIVAGTILGRIGQTSTTEAAHTLFEVRPAGRGAPRIDPKPILDGWKLLESTAIYRAAGKNPFFGRDAANPSIGQILLMSKEALLERVLANPRVDIYGCGRNDVRTGQIDRRVLATLEFLAASGFRPSVSSLKCGHGFFTASGNVSQHSSGNAVDIPAVNGIPILGNQGKGSVTELAIRRLLTLQGTMEPDQIISLMKFEGTDNTMAMGDHADHIHIGWKPLYGTNSKAAKQVNAILKPKQWIKLIDRLDEIDNPTVRLKPSKQALKVTKRASDAHSGE